MLWALKGLVKLQALVCGHNIWKQANMTLRCMQVLVRVRDQRMHLSQDSMSFSMSLSAGGGGAATASCGSTKSASTHPRSSIWLRKCWIAGLLSAALNVYMQLWRNPTPVADEMDVDGGGQQPRWAEQWMASRASFDTNRSSIRGAGLRRSGARPTLEIDTAWPISYSTPRRRGRRPRR